MGGKLDSAKQSTPLPTEEDSLGQRRGRIYCYYLLFSLLSVKSLRARETVFGRKREWEYKRGLRMR